MNTLITLFTILVLIIKSNLLNAQFTEQDYISAFNNSSCGITDEVLGTHPQFPVDNDTLRILVIFAKFPDDTWDPIEPGSQPTYYWPGQLTTLHPGLPK